MNTLTRDEAAARLAKEKGCPREVAKEFADKFLDIIKRALAAGETVEFRNFGVFKVVTRKERKGRNPKHPEQGVLIIPARKAVKFKSSKKLNETL